MLTIPKVISDFNELLGFRNEVLQLRKLKPGYRYAEKLM